MANSTETRKVKIITDAQQANASLNQLKASVASINKELNKTQRGTSEWENLNKELKKAATNYGKARAEVSAFDNTSKRFWANAKQMMAGVVGGNLITAAMQGLKSYFVGIVEHASKISDALAGVQKTTGLTTGEVNELSRALGELNTRTSKHDLLSIAKDAGKLGITGVNNLKEFTAAFDKVNVALGEDLGQEGITNMAKINDLFGETKNLGIDKSMMSTASAINSLGQAGTAQETYIVDFTKRLAGIANQAEISLPNILGLAATLDELGQTSEVSSTSLTQLFLQMQKDSSIFGKAAGINVQKFADMVKNDANGALLEFLKGVNKNSDGLSGLAKNFDNLGIDGTRAIGVIAALSQNTEKLAEKQAFANSEYQKGNSVLNEFNTNNNTFAAKMEKLGKALKGAFLDNPLSTGIQTFLVKLSGLVEKEEDLTNSIRKAIPMMNAQFEILKDGNVPVEERRMLINKINSEYGSYLPKLLTEKSSLDEIKTAQDLVNKGMMKKIILMTQEKELQTAAELASRSFNMALAARQQIAVEEASSQANHANIEMLKQRAKDYEESARVMMTTAVVNANNKAKEMLKMMGLDDAAISSGGSNSTKSEASVDTAASSKGGKELTIDQLIQKEKIKAAKEAAKINKEVFDMSVEDLLNNMDKYVDERVEKIKDEGKTTQEMYQEIYDDNVKDLNIYFDTLENQYKISYLKGEITQKQYNELLIQSDNEKYNQLNSLAEQFNIDNTDILLEHLQNQANLKQDALNKEVADVQKAEDLKKNAINTANNNLLQAERELTNGTINLVRQRQNIQYNNLIKSLNDQEKIEIASAETRGENTSAIEQKYIDLRNEAALKKAKRDRSIALFEIGVNTARAIISALAEFGPAGPAVAASYGAIGAVQAGLVLAQPMPEFAFGGSTVQGASGKKYNATNVGSFASGGAVSSPSYGIIGEAGPELVIPNYLYTAPQWQSTMSQLESAIGTREFANGGKTKSSSSTNLEAVIAMNTQIIAQLSAQLQKPIEAVTYFNQNEYDRNAQNIATTRKIALGLS